MRFPLAVILVVPLGWTAACGSAFTSAPTDGGADGSVVDGAPIDASGGDGCVAKTCAELHWACGAGDDGCGKTIDCGACHTTNYACGAGGTAHACSCKAKTCFDLGYSCGDADDGCGGTLHCGTCTTTGFTCGGGGVDHHCGLGQCMPKTCAGIGAMCGNPSDGCGGSLGCGVCPAQDVCDPSYQCKCVASTCGQRGWTCGQGPDGCGGMIDCGGCPGTNDVCQNHACIFMGCTPQTSCAQKGYSCGVIFNGCANESCGSGPPARDMAGDVQCQAHGGKPNFYACACGTGTGPVRDVDSGRSPHPDPPMPPDGGLACGEGAPNPPVPGWNCDIVSPGAFGDGLTFCCAQ